MGAVIFDLDRTLTRQPTWMRFLLSANARRPAFWARLPALAVHGVAYKSGIKSRDSVKAHALQTLSWTSREELGDQAARFAAQELQSGLRPGAIRVIEQHRCKGDRLILATAAVDFIADPIARGLGFDLVIATLTAWQNGPCLDSANCYGPEKLARVNNALDGERPIMVYTDHVSDLALMDWADAAVAVNPSPGLFRAARARGYEIADWNA